jgi:hypothetical protein
MNRTKMVISLTELRKLVQTKWSLLMGVALIPRSITQMIKDI